MRTLLALLMMSGLASAGETEDRILKYNVSSVANVQHVDVFDGTVKVVMYDFEQATVNAICRWKGVEVVYNVSPLEYMKNHYDFVGADFTSGWRCADLRANPEF